MAASKMVKYLGSSSQIYFNKIFCLVFNTNITVEGHFWSFFPLCESLIKIKGIECVQAE